MNILQKTMNEGAEKELARYLNLNILNVKLPTD